MSEKPWLRITEQQIVELLWGRNGKGRWKGGAVRAGGLSRQSALDQVWKAKLSCLLFSFVVSILNSNAKSPPVTLKRADCLIRKVGEWAGGNRHFKYLTLAVQVHLSGPILVSAPPIFCASI